MKEGKIICVSSDSQRHRRDKSDLEYVKLFNIRININQVSKTLNKTLEKKLDTQ